MRTVVTLIPDLKIGIVVLANLNLTVLPEVIRARFLEMHLGEYTKTSENDFNRFQMQLDALIASPELPKEPSPIGHPLDRYAGTFSNELYGEFSISKKNDGLQLEAGPAHFQGSLDFWGNDTFLLRWPEIDAGHELVTFVFDSNDKVKEMQTETLGTFVIRSKN